MRNHDAYAQSPHSWTPQVRRNTTQDAEMILVAQDERIDYRIHQRMHHMLTKQNPYPSQENTHLLHSLWSRNTTLWKHIHGPNYRSPATMRTWCNPNHCRLRMFVGCPLPTLCHNNHRTWNCTTIFRSHGTMVWTAQKDNQWPRSPIHLPLQASISE
jgi:hypothetical protein